MDVMLLPDEVLLTVLGHLSSRELFSSRLVCRRFRDLCLHRCLWKEREIGGYASPFNSPRVSIQAALRLVPCLGKLTFLSGVELRSCAQLVSRTSCAVSKLAIGDDWTQIDITQEMILIVEKFAAAGGLRELRLGFYPCESHSTLTGVLLKAVYAIKELKCLYMSCLTPLICDVSFGEVAPSLTNLEFRSAGHSTYSSNPFVELLLRAHAATLQTVLVELNDVPMHLLAVIPNLRSVSCFPQQDLPCLLDCPNLASFELIHVESIPAFPTGTVEFFRRASNLRTVTTFLPEQDPACVILALAGSEAAGGLEVLDIYSTENEEAHAALANLLPKFSSLQKLALSHAPSVDLLRTISPVTTPCLTTFTSNAYGGVDPCYHSWLHGPAVQHLLARNPRLHLQFETNGWLVDCKDCKCDWCAWGCHADLRRGYMPDTGFSAHSEDKCRESTSCVQIAYSPSLW